MKEKELYASPETEVMEILLDGVIAASVELTTVSDPFAGFGSELEW